MDTIFILLILFAALLVGLLLLANRVPGAWVVEKAVLVQASPAQIFPYLDTLENWPKWTVWNPANEPTLQLAYEGPKLGIGATQVWQHPRLRGRLVVTRSDADRELNFRFDVAGTQLHILGTIVLDAADPQFTQVAWRCQLPAGSTIRPLQRVQAYFLHQFFDSGVEESLNNLQAMFEGSDSDVSETEPMS